MDEQGSAHTLSEASQANLQRMLALVERAYREGQVEKSESSDGTVLSVKLGRKDQNPELWAMMSEIHA